MKIVKFIQFFFVFISIFLHFSPFSLFHALFYSTTIVDGSMNGIKVFCVIYLGTMIYIEKKQEKNNVKH